VQTGHNFGDLIRFAISSLDGDALAWKKNERQDVQTGVKYLLTLRGVDKMGKITLAEKKCWTTHLDGNRV
jgi:hypothetical protein